MSDPTEGLSISDDQPDDGPGTLPAGVPPASDRQWLDMLQQAVDAIMIRLEKLEEFQTAANAALNGLANDLNRRKRNALGDLPERIEGLEQFKTQVGVWVGDFEQRMEKLMAKPKPKPKPKPKSKSKSKKRKAKKSEPRTAARQVVRQGARLGGQGGGGLSGQPLKSRGKSRARR